MDRRTLLFGRDETPGIVSAAANREGRAWVWRRVDGHVVLEEDAFLNWFLIPDRAFLEGIPCQPLSISDTKSPPTLEPGSVGVVELQGDHYYRYLVLTRHLSQVESLLIQAYNQRTGSKAKALYELRQAVYSRPPVEQYLAITGRTYFKGMTYDDLHRMQFDLETTGLDPSTDQIFMVAISDSLGYREVLDVRSMSESELIQRLSNIVRQRDPDVLENHNIFEFDINFLVRRAKILGVSLAMGRDGGSFTQFRDTLKVGEKSEYFLRYGLWGREIVDTLHAVKRYGAIVRDLRSRGLKQAARHFGVAREDREYVPGAETWATFQKDPERVRRYALDDVQEVDELSRLLLASPFALASMVPKPYERIATAGNAQGLIEPLMVRAYIAEGHSLPLPDTTEGGFEGGRTELFASGVIPRVVKADVASLYPSIMIYEKLGPRSDAIGAFLALLEELTQRRLHHKAQARAQPPGSREWAYHDAIQGAMKVLINSFYGALGTNLALFSDIRAAARIARRGREILSLMLSELRRRGMALIEADTDGVFFSVPPDWTEGDEKRLVEELGAALPGGIEVEHDGRYKAMYSYAEKNYVLQGYDGSIKIVGAAFRSTKAEPYAERFLAQAMPLLLADDKEGLRRLYADLVDRLWRREIPVRDLCVSMPLTKSPERYKAAGRKEEQYEVVIATGRTSWRASERVSYYQAAGKKKKLLQAYDQDYDPAYYVEKLRKNYAWRLAKAFDPQEFEALVSYGQPG